jgi:hypothetical protein
VTTPDSPGLARSCAHGLRLVAVALATPLLFLSGAADAQAAEQTDAAPFARVATDDEGQPRALQMAIARYADPQEARGLRVDLIGAVHIGDRGYYAELNERFRDYDVLLYELVAPEGASVRQRDGERKSFISSTQLAMRTALGLEFQLDEIDYEADNFVHADLSPDEFRQTMNERGESLYVYFWRAFYASMSEASRDPLGLRDWRWLSSMLFSDDPAALKKTIAYEMTRIDDVSQFLEGDNGSAVIAARNQRAIEVLEEQIDAGNKRIGIFYGVAHMPDFDKRLVEQLGLTRTGTQWVDAWRLSDAKPPLAR